MRKKILAFMFAVALLVAMSLPLFGNGGTAFADEGGIPNQNASENAKGMRISCETGWPHAFEHYPWRLVELCSP